MSRHPPMPLVVPFEDYRPELRPVVGGKSAGLAEMAAAGLPVPPGFAVTTEAFATLGDADVARDVDDLVSRADPSDPARVEAISAAIRARIESAPVDARVADAVAAGYHELCRRRGVDDVAVAVRSSAADEDSAHASFAGEHDSFLAIGGSGEVVRHVVRCWSSLWTARAICYRARMGDATAPLAMGVTVQTMVRPRAAGVAITLNPVNGDRSQVAIDASWGHGLAVVSGEVTPDSYLVDKVVLEITRRCVSPKTKEYRLTGNGMEWVEVPGRRATAPCLTDGEIQAVARLARLVERHYGSPQDIEWAVDGELDPPVNVVLLQARPETVWSPRPRPPVARSGSLLDSIVDTLRSPLHAGGKE